MKPQLFIFFLISPFCIAQQKGDNTIILPKVNIDSVSKVLARNGYVIINSNNYQIVTDLNPLKKNNSIKVKLAFYFADSNIELTGKTNDVISASLKGHNNSDIELITIENRGSKKSWMREVWDEMNRIALEISSGVVYSKK
jgi:hypothetical protein